MWIVNRDKGGIERLGLLTSIIQSHDSRRIAEQIEARYIGGWRPSKAGKHTFDVKTGRLSYPGDPDLMPDAVYAHVPTGEMALLYPYDWLLILQPDNTWELSRVD